MILGRYLCKKNLRMKLHKYLGALDVIVQVITEGVNEIDGVVSGVGVGMTREQD